MSVYAARLRLGASLIALAALVSGCGGDPPAPPPFTPSTVASSPTPTPTGPVEPVLPPAAKAPTAAGAEAFAEFYWEVVVSYAQATGDTGLLRAIAASTCYPCDGGADAIEDIYGRSGSIVGGQATVHDLAAAKIGNDIPRFSLRFKLSNTAQLVDFPGGGKDSTLEASTHSADMRVDFIDGSWLVSGWTLR